MCECHVLNPALIALLHHCQCLSYFRVFLTHQCTPVIYRTEVERFQNLNCLLERGYSHNAGLEENAFWLFGQIFCSKHLQQYLLK